jgi:hypothetical protein
MKAEPYTRVKGAALVEIQKIAPETGGGLLRDAAVVRARQRVTHRKRGVVNCLPT